jgi:hypothetical protein
LWHVGFQLFFFLSYYLLKFDEFIFYFQETYNIWLEKRYEDDFSTHLNIDSDLWLEAGSSGGFDGNQVYKLSNTTTENLRMTCSVSSVGCLQLVSSTQSSEFVDLLDQGVQERTTNLNEKYERFFTDYEKLCPVVMKMRSKMSGHVYPLIGLTVMRTTSLLLFQRSLYSSYFIFEHINF